MYAIINTTGSPTAHLIESNRPGVRPVDSSPADSGPVDSSPVDSSPVSGSTLYPF